MAMEAEPKRPRKGPDLKIVVDDGELEAWIGAVFVFSFMFCFKTFGWWFGFVVW